MKGRNLVIVMFLCFVAGSLTMVFIRGSGRDTSPEPVEATAAEPDHAESEAAADPTPTGQSEILPDHTGHEAPPEHAASTGSSTMWVCEQDPMIGLSWAGKCPIDGKPMVERAVDLSEVTDLHNETCPIMGGAAQDDIFALYHGKKVHFCCKGCDTDFFKEPEVHIQELTR